MVPHTGSFLPYMLQRFTGVSGILASIGMTEAVDGTIVECNTAYGGSRSETAMHYQVAEDHGFTEIADFHSGLFPAQSLHNLEIFPDLFLRLFRREMKVRHNQMTNRFHRTIL